jgi:Flp pilus assembly protein TadG
MSTDRPPRVRRPDRSPHGGQVMLIFALIAVLLFAVAGLAIDAGISYFSSDSVQRAANAAALAGVAYLPGEYPQGVNAALVESARNGFTDAGTADVTTGTTSCTGGQSPCVLVTRPTTNELTVTISVSVPTTFLKLIGFGAHTVTRTATAEYLPPIALGQPGAQQGSDMASLGTSGNYYFQRTEGWGTPRSQGDPFTPSPNQGGSGCGPGGSSNCSAMSAPDIHLISPANGTEQEANNINYTGGSSFLIDVPPGQSVDLQIYNPSFAPDTCGNNITTTYCYHENDGTFDNAIDTAYATMEYSVYQVQSLSQPGSGNLVSQEVFYPIDDTGTPAMCSGSTFCYINSGGSFTKLTSGGSACTPNVYHAWVSALDYTPDTCDASIFYHSVSLGSGQLTNATSTDAYYRLEVDTLTWNGNTICTTAAGCTAAESASTATSAYPEAHKGYAVRLTAPGTSTVCSSSVPACSSSSVSALQDMILFTPVINPSSTQPFSFGIPLFHLDPAYAGTTVDVDVFDPGDVGGGPAYMAIAQPDGSLATATITALGNTLNSGGTTTVSPATPWPPTGAACTACFQSADSSGNAIYNGQWLQLAVQVPTTLNTTSPGSACFGLTQAQCWSQYWSLQYEVSKNVHSDDTFGVQVGYNGSPDRLLP